MMFVRRTRGVVAIAGVLFAAGCEDPELNTDLRPAGDPEVLAVLVMTDALTRLAEKATFCKPGDALRPSLVGLPDFTTEQVCPEELGESVEPVANAFPDGWYVRLMFDELLDPSIEVLTEILDEDTGEGTGAFSGSIRGANPVTLECRSVSDNEFVNVDYDGYYSPAGNRVTWPVGPSLVIKPNDPTLIATGTECRITLHESIRDKDGHPVPEDQRGPYGFSVAPVKIIATDPVDSADPEAPAEIDAAQLYVDNFYFQFNTDVTLASFCADADSPGTFANEFADADAGSGLCDEGTESFALAPPVLASDAGGGWGVCNISGDPCSTVADCVDVADEHCDSSYVYSLSGLAADDEIGIGYATPLKAEQLYTFSLKEGTKVFDRCGLATTLPAPTVDNLQSITFLTNKFDVAGTNVVTGDVAPMTRKPTLSFTNAVDPASLDASEFTIAPAPDSFSTAQVTGADLIFAGNYAPATEYTLTINEGATFSDYYGKVITTDAPTVINWTTEPRVALTALDPPNNTQVQKTRLQERIGITLTFNANIDPATLTGTDFKFVNLVTGANVANLPSFSISVGASGQSCAPSSLGCQLTLRADLAPGTYRFTLLANASFSDRLGNVYRPEKDMVTNFTVLPVSAATRCL